MKLAAFVENQPYSLDDYPFNDMYVTDRKFVKVGIKDGNTWLGILIGDNSDLDPSLAIPKLNEYTSFQSYQPVTKSEVIRKVYSVDEEAKILRDAAAGRNMDKFAEYDTFVESLPSV